MENGPFEPPSLPKTDKTSTFIHHHIPNVTQKEPVMLGVDEAGRGPVLGPMVYGIAFAPLTYLEELKTHGYNDSKVLSSDVRLSLFKEALKSPRCDSIGWATTVMTAADIGEGMLNPDAPYNLNDQAHDTTIALIRKVLDSGVEVAELYVDTVGSPDKYQQKLSRVFPEIGEIVVAKKADSLYPIVSLASIFAKVTRDLSLEDQLTGCGSGYPSDPNTVQWLKSNMDRLFGWGPLVRYSWGTAKAMLEKDGIEIEWKSEREETEARRRVIMGKVKPRTYRGLPRVGMHQFGEPYN